MTQFSKERAELNFRVYIQPQGNAEATLFLSRIAPSVKTNVDTHSSSLTNFKVEPIHSKVVTSLVFWRPYSDSELGLAQMNVLSALRILNGTAAGSSSRIEG